MWTMARLLGPPQTWPFPGLEQEAGEDLEPILYAGVPWRGEDTRVFAWCGVPAGADDQGPVPGIVLVHGGGGTAFSRWARLWLSRGYAVIAMDTCGCVPVPEESGGWRRQSCGGPGGWGGFESAGGPACDQWTYHAVSAVVRGHSLLRAMPGVDPERIAVTGISWGGYLTCIVAGVDQRFKAAVPVYGCGFLGEDSAWVETFQGMGEERSEAWLRAWDPGHYLPCVTIPMLWVTGTNDFAYPLSSLRRSYRLPAGEVNLAIRVRMPHGHGDAGEGPEEIHAFVNAILRGKKRLMRVSTPDIRARKAKVSFEPVAGAVSAELNLTADTGPWPDRHWVSRPARLDPVEGTASGTVPDRTEALYMNIFDARGLVSSSPHVVLSERKMRGTTGMT